MSRFHLTGAHQTAPESHVSSAWLAARFGTHAGIVLDSHGVIVAANTQAAALLGRTAGKLVSTPFGILTPVSRRIELDIVTAKGRRRGRVAAEIQPREQGDEYVYVRLDEVAACYRSLNDILRDAAADVNRAFPPAKTLEILPLATNAAVRVESRKILADWFAFLLDLAGPSAPKIQVSCEARSKAVEVRLDLDQTGLDPGDAPVLPFPEHSAGLLEEIGGAFCVVADYPATSVQITLPSGKPNIC